MCDSSCSREDGDHMTLLYKLVLHVVYIFVYVGSYNVHVSVINRPVSFRSQ